MQKYKINKKESGYNGHSPNCIKELAKKDNIRSYLYNPKNETVLSDELLSKYVEISVENDLEMRDLYLFYRRPLEF